MDCNFGMVLKNNLFGEENWYDRFILISEQEILNLAMLLAQNLMEIQTTCKSSQHAWKRNPSSALNVQNLLPEKLT
jgi:hypothetical protein